MKIFLSLLLALSLNAAGFWTLTGLQKANIYVENQISTLKIETIEKIKAKMTEALHKNGIATEKQDSATLMCSLEELSGDETSYIYIKLSLGEEVQTFRKAKNATYALTFQATDFIETDGETMEHDILESLNYLLTQFSELYGDDNEQ